MKSRRKIIGIVVFIIMSTLFVSCGDETVPKPQAYLRLDYPIEGNHVMYDGTCPFTFEFNSQSIMKSKGNCNFILEYPKMKGTIHLTYKPVSDNIKVLLRDAQKLTYEHVIKANTIKELPFSNGLENVHGMFYQVGGNAATNAQFYVTDSTNHFLTGSIYFHTKPNYDSIMPAVSYIKEDMQNIMETIKWRR